jgi:hypothetical protein
MTWYRRFLLLKRLDLPITLHSFQTQEGHVSDLYLLKNDR